MAFCFPKRLRLRKRSEFLAVQRSGRKIHGTYFVVVVLRAAGSASAERAKSDEDEPETNVGRLGITVSKKVGIAVKRNRIRRLVREYVRMNPTWIPDRCDVVVIAKRNAAELSGLAAVAADLGRITNRLRQC